MAQGPLPVIGARVLARLLICPGGNLETLILLAWRVIRDAAVLLAPALEEHADSVPDGNSRYPESLRLALGGLGPVPAYPLFGWSDAGTVHELVYGYPAFIWGSTSVGAMAERAVRRVVGLKARLSAPNAHRNFRFQKFDSFDKRLNWDRTVGHNVVAYGTVCARLLSETVVALRILSHVAHLLRVVHVYRSEALLYRPKRWAGTMRRFAGLDVSVLDDFFHDVVSAALVPLPWLWHAERELESLVVRAAPFALHELWGVPFNQPDSLDRAGASCPDNGRYVAPHVVPRD